MNSTPEFQRSVSARAAYYSASLLARLGIAVLCIGFFCAATPGADNQPLTPEQRLEKLEQAQKTHGEPPHETRDDVRVNVAGVVITEDDAPVPQGVSVSVRSQSRSYSSIVEVKLRDDQFDCSVPPGFISVWVNAEGYAPAVVGPRVIAENARWVDFEVILRKGFQQRLRITDEIGHRIPGARISASVLLDDQSLRQWMLESDKEGLANLEHLSDGLTVHVNVLAAGYQHETVERKAKRGEDLEVTLRRAASSEGIVTDGKTGRPVPDAQLFVIHSSGPFPYPIEASPNEQSPEAAIPVDAQGRFTLTSLRDDATYSLFIRAEGYAPAFLHDARAGRNDLRVPLGPPIHVKGRVLGPLDGLPAEISYGNPYTVPGGSSWEWIKNIPLDVRDGVGDFEIDGLWPGTLHINAGSRAITLTLTDSLDDYVIDLRPPAPGAPAAERPLVIRLLVPKGAPSKGTASLIIWPGTPNSIGNTKEVSFDGAEARLDVPAPSRLELRSGALIGYWFEPVTMDCAATGDELVWEVPVHPAGAFIGRVIDAEGHPVLGASVTSFAVRRTTIAEPLPTPDTSDAGPDGRFMVTPVAYGVPYILVAGKNAQFIVGDEMTLDAKTPLRETVLKFAPGIKLQGSVLLPDGAPAEFVDVRLSYDTPWDHSFSHTVKTDRLGHFEMDGVNPDAPGKYALEVQSRRTYRPYRLGITPDELDQIITLNRGEVLKGNVTDQDTHAPIAGVEVYAIKQGAPFDSFSYIDADEPTNDRGEFEFTRLAPVRYNLGVYSADVIGEPTAIGGQPDAVHIQVRQRK